MPSVTIDNNKLTIQILKNSLPLPVNVKGCGGGSDACRGEEAGGAGGGGCMGAKIGSVNGAGVAIASVIFIIP